MCKTVTVSDDCKLAIIKPLEENERIPFSALKLGDTHKSSA